MLSNACLSPSDLECKFVELFPGSYTPTPQVFLGAFTEKEDLSRNNKPNPFLLVVAVKCLESMALGNAFILAF